MPIIIACIVAVLYCIDNLIAPNIIKGSSFMWVAFVGWTISSSLSFNDKIKLFIGNIIGFISAVGMIYFGKIFDASVLGISIAGVLGVFIFNGLVVYFDNFKKIWLNSLSGIFMGIFLTFSGLGVGLAPNSWANAGILIGTILLYNLLGLICATLSNYLYNKWKKPENFKKFKEIDVKNEK